RTRPASRVLSPLLFMATPHLGATPFPYTTLFRSGGKVTMKLSEKQTSPEHIHLRCIISDNGIGMKKDFLSLVFLPFEQETAEIADRKSTRLNSSHVSISYAVFCLKKKKCSEERRT